MLKIAQPTLINISLKLNPYAVIITVLHNNYLLILIIVIIIIALLQSVAYLVIFLTSHTSKFLLGFAFVPMIMFSDLKKLRF